MLCSRKYCCISFQEQNLDFPVSAACLVLLAVSLTEATTLEFVTGKKWVPGHTGSLRSLDLASMGPLSLKTLVGAQMRVKTAHIYLAMDHPCMNVDWAIPDPKNISKTRFRSVMYKSIYLTRSLFNTNSYLGEKLCSICTVSLASKDP